MAPGDLQVEVVVCPQPGMTELVALTLPAGAVLADALHASGLLHKHGLAGSALRVGVWGQLRDMHWPLRQHDRVEIYRALVVDPKAARHQRHQRQREKAARG